MKAFSAIKSGTPDQPRTEYQDHEMNDVVLFPRLPTSRLEATDAPVGMMFHLDGRDYYVYLMECDFRVLMRDMEYAANVMEISKQSKAE